MTKVIENALEFVKDFFKGESSGHDYFHTYRVYNMAKHLAKNEDVDELVVMLASLLHDVDDIKISPNTYANKDNARNFLKTNRIDEVTINFICQVINEISYKGNESISPSTLEGKIVQDADRLDAIGAIGIARAFAFGGSRNRTMHDPDELPSLNMSEQEYRNHVSTTVNHFYEKLFNLTNLMNTEAAKKIAIQREKYMKDFLAEFYSEWSGEK